MTDSTEKEIIQLVKVMRKDLRDWDWEGDENFDAAPKYGKVIRRLGALPVIEGIFASANHSHPESLLLSFAFMWEDLRYEDWLTLTRRLADDRYAGKNVYGGLYDFVVFAGRYLAIDICRTIATDPQVPSPAKANIAHIFFTTPSLGLEWVNASLEDAGIDSQALWQRLESEGAPMNYPMPIEDMRQSDRLLHEADEHWAQGRLLSAYALYARQAANRWHAAFQLAWIDAAFGKVDEKRLQALRRGQRSTDARELLGILIERVNEPEPDACLHGSLEEWDIEALKRQPGASDHRWWENKGDQALAAGQWGLAEACYDEACERSPSLSYDPPAKMHGLLGLIEGHLKTLGE